MKIVYFAHSVLERGGDKVVLAHLSHLAGAGHRVTIRSNVVNTGFPLHPAIRVVPPLLPGKGGTLLSALLERQRADLVVATIVPTAVLLAVRNRGRVVHFAQDDNETAYRSGLGRLLMRLLYRFSFSLLSLPTVAVSEALAATFRNRYGAAVNVVANGVDTSVFYPDPSPELVAAKGGRRAVLLLSRPDPRKGFDLGIAALTELCRSFGDGVELWTVGDDPAATRFPCPHRHFGQVGEERLRALMSSADLFLSPSRSEGFPLMVLEAFACRCPVVTTEAIVFAREGENALVAPIGDVPALAGKMERLLTDAALADAVAEGGRRFALARPAAYSSERFAAVLEEHFPATV